MIDRGVGAQIADADLVGVIPHSLKRLGIVLQARELAVVDEATGRVVGEVLLVVELLHRRRGQPHRVVEGVGVEVVVGYAFDAAELLAIHAVEAVGEAFRRRGVHRVMVAFGLAPLLAQLVHALDNGQRELLAFRIPAVVAHPVLTVEHSRRLVQADVAQRYSGTLVAEELVDVVVGAEASEGAIAEQGRRVDRGGLLAAHDAELQRLVRDFHTLVEQLPEAVLVAVGLKGDTRHVDGDDAEVHAAVFDILAGLGVDPTLQEGTAAHRGLEGAGDLDDVVVEDDIRVHALGGAFERQLLHVVVRVARVGVDAVLDGEHELRENRGMAILAQAADTVEQDGTLDFAGEPRGAQAEADGHERGLAVGHTVGINLIFHGLHGVINRLAGHDLRIDFADLLDRLGIRVKRDVVGQRGTVLEVQTGRLLGLESAHDGFRGLDRHIVGEHGVGHLQVLFIVELRIRLKHLVGAVDGLAAVLCARDVLDDLRDLRGGGADGLRGVHHRVAKFKPMGEHVAEIRQRAVGHRSERRVISIMEVDVALHMGVGHGVRQHGERGCLGDGAGEQVALRGIDVGILVCVLTHEGFVAVDQTADRFVDIGGLGALDVLVQTIGRVVAGDLIQMVFDEAVLDQVLDVLDLGGTVVAFLDFAFDLVGEIADELLFLRTDFLIKVLESGLDGADDVDRIEFDDPAVTLLDEHLAHGFLPFCDGVLCVAFRGGGQRRIKNLHVHWVPSFPWVGLLPTFVRSHVQASTVPRYLVPKMRHCPRCSSKPHGSAKTRQM